MNDPQPISIKQAVFDWMDAYESAVINPDFSRHPPMDFMEDWLPNRATAFDIAVRWAEAGRPVLYLSLDVGLRHKLSAHFCETLSMDVWELTRLWLKKRTMEGLGRCMQRLHSLPLFCSSCEVPSITELGEQLHHAHLHHGAVAVAVDGADTMLATASQGSAFRLSDRSDVVRNLRDLQELYGYQQGAFAMRKHGGAWCV